MKNKFQKYFFLFLICLSVIVFILISISTITGRGIAINQEYNEKTILTFGLRINNLDQEEKGALTTEEQKKLSNNNIYPLIATLDYIYIPINIIETNQRLCFDKINIVPSNVGINSIPLRQPLLSDELCLNVGKNVFLEPIGNARLFGANSDPFFYPFDSRVINFTLEFTTFILDQNGEKNEIITNLGIDVIDTSRQWEKKPKVSEPEKVETKGKNIKIILTRPSIYIFLMIGLTVVIVWGIVVLLKYIDENNFYQITFGLLIGLWGIRQVLIPDYIEYPTLVNSIVLLLYVFLGFLMAYQHIRIMIKKPGSATSTLATNDSIKKMDENKTTMEQPRNIITSRQHSPLTEKLVSGKPKKQKTTAAKTNTPKNNTGSGNRSKSNRSPKNK